MVIDICVGTVTKSRNQSLRGTVSRSSSSTVIVNPSKLLDFVIHRAVCRAFDSIKTDSTAAWAEGPWGPRIWLRCHPRHEDEQTSLVAVFPRFPLHNAVSLNRLLGPHYPFSRLPLFAPSVFPCVAVSLRALEKGNGRFHSGTAVSRSRPPAPRRRANFFERSCTTSPLELPSGTVLAFEVEIARWTAERFSTTLLYL